MKILSVKQIREADRYTIEKEPINSIDLMERAATRCFDWIKAHHHEGNSYYIFCGMGNNGGDGLAIARMMRNEGWEVLVYILKISTQGSPDFETNLRRFNDLAPEAIKEITAEAILPEIPKQAIIVDALFGTGLSRPLNGLALLLVRYLNTLSNIKISIDLPSGLFADESIIKVQAEAVKADYTLSFNPPKLCFMVAENDRWVGRWVRLDIGLHPDFINSAETPFYFTELSDLKTFYRRRRRFEHKGNYGHALLIAGSKSKAGAAILAAKGCLASGVGLLTVHSVPSVIQALNISLPEAMASIDRWYERAFDISERYTTSAFPMQAESSNLEVIGNLPQLSSYSAIAAGPGLGTEEITAQMLKILIQEWKLPLVLDADALNILSENKTWLAFLPPRSILTPHPREFERLVGRAANDFERLEMARDFAFRYQVYVVLKGGVTAVISPYKKVYFNSSGNAGLATGGSGDVLTGILVGLLAQGYSPEDAARLGVWLHGAAADLALDEESMETLLPSRLPQFMAKAWKMLTP